MATTPGRRDRKYLRWASLGDFPSGLSPNLAWGGIEAFRGRQMMGWLITLGEQLVLTRLWAGAEL